MISKFFAAFLLLLIGIAITHDIGAQSQRKREKYRRADGKILYCLRPPADVLTTSNVKTVDAKIPKLIDIIKNGGGAGFNLNQQKEIKRIREELSSLNIYEVMEYRLCVQTGSNVLTLEEYKLAAAELRKPLTQAVNSNAGNQQGRDSLQSYPDKNNLIKNSGFEEDFKEEILSDDEYFEPLDSLIIDERDRILIEHVTKLENQREEAKQIGIIYGARHMRSTMKFLMQKLNYRIAKSEWVTVFDL